MCLILSARGLSTSRGNTVVSEDRPVHSSVGGATGGPLTFGMLARQEYTDSAAWESVLAMNYQKEFAAASAEAGTFSFTFQTGASSALSIWAYSSSDAWLEFNKAMGEKLGKEMVPKLKAMDAKVFGTINAEAQAAMGACLPAPGPPRIVGLAACVFGVRIIFRICC